jgi:hypothetical protein
MGLSTGSDAISSSSWISKQDQQDYGDADPAADGNGGEEEEEEEDFGGDEDDEEEDFGGDEDDEEDEEDEGDEDDEEEEEGGRGVEDDPAFKQAMQGRLSFAPAPAHELNVLCCSANIGNTKILPGDLKKWLYGARFPTEIYTRGCHWSPRQLT